MNRQVALVTGLGFVCLVAGAVWAFGGAYGLLVAGAAAVVVGLFVDMG